MLGDDLIEMRRAVDRDDLQPVHAARGYSMKTAYLETGGIE